MCSDKKAYFKIVKVQNWCSKDYSILSETWLPFSSVYYKILKKNKQTFVLFFDGDKAVKSGTDWKLSKWSFNRDPLSYELDCIFFCVYQSFYGTKALS